jgi:NADH-quinone oxidoreductase subunit K
MITKQLTANFFLSLFGVLGIILNRKNILLTLMCLEVVLVGVDVNFIVFSMYLDDFVGQIFSMFILTIAASEAAIGLAIIIIYYRVRGQISFNQHSILKG